MPKLIPRVFNGDARTACVSLSHPVTSSRASSPRDRVGVNPRFRLLRPDGATGLGSLRAPSIIQATSPGFQKCGRGLPGVSLRILSADSLSNSMLSSALEWDYYDPSYVNQNNIPKNNHRRPGMNVKQNRV
ncbi:protein huluwa [Nematolebias whitei]|uniref:protein huluwa n=1 Tax=Nematolebias whitei TaxID=451745 RepID=UPI00189784B3|nr:protein huluwa [Nematolebias whitei]